MRLLSAERTPRKRRIQYSVTAAIDMSGAAYVIIRFRMMTSIDAVTAHATF
jgi:hypothetical protein